MGTVNDRIPLLYLTPLTSALDEFLPEEAHG